jgi:hypothetical protein
MFPCHQIHGVGSWTDEQTMWGREKFRGGFAVRSVKRTIEWTADPGVLLVSPAVVGRIKEGIVFDHVCPFKDLGSNVDKKGIGGPSSEDHDFVDRVIIQEEGHLGTGSQQVGPCRVEAEGFLSTA